MRPPYELDIAQLIRTFASRRDPSLRAFKRAWKAINATLLWCCVDDFVAISPVLLDRYAQLLFGAALHYLGPNFPLGVRVGALYALYCLHYTQPRYPRSRIVVTVRMWQWLVGLVRRCVVLGVVPVYQVAQQLWLSDRFLFSAVHPRTARYTWHGAPAAATHPHFEAEGIAPWHHIPCVLGDAPVVDASLWDVEQLALALGMYDAALDMPQSPATAPTPATRAATTPPDPPSTAGLASSSATTPPKAPTPLAEALLRRTLAHRRAIAAPLAPARTAGPAHGSDCPWPPTAYRYPRPASARIMAGGPQRSGEGFGWWLPFVTQLEWTDSVLHRLHAHRTHLAAQAQISQHVAQDLRHWQTPQHQRIARGPDQPSRTLTTKAAGDPVDPDRSGGA